MKVIAIMVGCFALFIGSCMVGMNQYVEYKCSRYGEVTGRRVAYVQFDSCYVEIGGRMERWEAYKRRVTAIEGLKQGESE